MIEELILHLLIRVSNCCYCQRRHFGLDGVDCFAMVVVFIVVVICVSCLYNPFRVYIMAFGALPWPFCIRFWSNGP